MQLSVDRCAKLYQFLASNQPSNSFHHNRLPALATKVRHFQDVRSDISLDLPCLWRHSLHDLAIITVVDIGGRLRLFETPSACM